jgi:hypothetical protein
MFATVDSSIFEDSFHEIMRIPDSRKDLWIKFHGGRLIMVQFVAWDVVLFFIAYLNILPMITKHTSDKSK